MKIPSDPAERFQYYFDITTGLDEKYQEKIDKINSEKFDYNPGNTAAYKRAVKENEKQAELIKEQRMENYAELSEGYMNSMQKVQENNVNREKKRLDAEVYNNMYDNKYREWQENKQRRIQSAMKRYARTYGNAYYNMLKANEEIKFKNAQAK